MGQDAKACIDQFEFPDIPTAYPVVWVKAREAAEVCEVMGKRLCDAHEWEGACAGDLEPPDYRWDLAKGLSPNAAVERTRAADNRADGTTKSWSYGPAYEKGVCATSSQKSPGCNGGSWTECGSNTFAFMPVDIQDRFGELRSGKRVRTRCRNASCQVRRFAGDQESAEKADTAAFMP